MERDKEIEYCYQTVVNIVADMVIEYLRGAAREERSKQTSSIVNFEPKARTVEQEIQAKKAA